MPRFQFTIRGLLWATFWVAVSCGAWTIVFRLWPAKHWPDKYLAALLVVVGIVALATPFVAVGALFDKPRKGLAVFGQIVLLGPEAWIVIGVIIVIVTTSVVGWIKPLID